MSNQAQLEKFQKLTGQLQGVAEEAPQEKKEEKLEQKKEDGLKHLSTRERSIVEAVMENIDFGQLLIEDYLEADVPVRKDLTIRFRSPRGDAAFRYQEYVNSKHEGYRKALEDAEKNNKPPPPAFVETANLKVVWALADCLLSVNGQEFMPGSVPERDVDYRIGRLLEKSKHVLDQFIWAHNLFDFAMRQVCDGEGLEEELKNS